MLCSRDGMLRRCDEAGHSRAFCGDDGLDRLVVAHRVCWLPGIVFMVLWYSSARCHARACLPACLLAGSRRLTCNNNCCEVLTTNCLATTLTASLHCWLGDFVLRCHRRASLASKSHTAPQVATLWWNSSSGTPSSHCRCRPTRTTCCRTSSHSRSASRRR